MINSTLTDLKADVSLRSTRSTSLRASYDGETRFERGDGLAVALPPPIHPPPFPPLCAKVQKYRDQQNQINKKNSPDNMKEKTFRELFDKYGRKLYETARRHVSSSDAEDIVQELFLDIWEKRNEIRVKDSWDKYLYAVLKYRIIRFLNTKNEMEESLREALLEMGSRNKILSFEELYVKMEAAIELLPDARKTILQKRYFENMKIKDIAEELRISRETVKQQLKRARALLERELKGALANFLTAYAFRSS